MKYKSNSKAFHLVYSFINLHSLIYTIKSYKAKCKQVLNVNCRVEYKTNIATIFVYLRSMRTISYAAATRRQKRQITTDIQCVIRNIKDTSKRGI